MSILTFFWCAILSFAFVQAAIPNSDVKFKIFDDQSRDFESNVRDSLETTKNFFAQEEVANIVDTGSVIVGYVPYVGQLSGLMPVLRDTLAEESDWKETFTKAIAHETKREIAESNIRWMEATMKTIQDKIPLLGDDNPDRENRKTIASYMHSELDKMINFFGHTESLFRKYPLDGSPPLIQLALLVAIFSPIARTLIPLESKNPQISCKIRDQLLDYRPRTVNARLEKLSTKISIRTVIDKTLAKTFNENGYNETSPGEIRCERGGCSKPYFSPFASCLKDSFADDEYYVENYEVTTCIEDYSSLVRHRVEQMFPVQLLEDVCIEPKSREPTGFGWLTIKLGSLRAFGGVDGSTCDTAATNQCDPYVKLFINGENVRTSGARANNCCHDVDVTYTSKKIKKSSTIMIEVWDDDSGFLGSADDLILRSSGDVDSFLNEPIRLGAIIYNLQNQLETVSFWQDEYRLT